MLPLILFLTLFGPALALLLAAERGQPLSKAVVAAGDAFLARLSDGVWAALLVAVLLIADLLLWLAERVCGIVELLRRPT